MDQKEPLLDVCLRAVYAGHKYKLAISAAIDCYERGEHDTPTNDHLIGRYHDEWLKATEKAIGLHENLGKGGTA
jgi:hypothetical protein